MQSSVQNSEKKKAQINTFSPLVPRAVDHITALSFFSGGPEGGAIEPLFALPRREDFAECICFSLSHNFLFHTGNVSLSTAFSLSISSSISPLPNGKESTLFPLAVL